MDLYIAPTTSAFKQVTRYYLLAVAFSAVLFSAHWLKPPGNPEEAQKAQEQLQRAQTAATQVQVALRSYLTAIAEPQFTSQQAIRQLLTDVRAFGKALPQISSALARTKGLTAESRVLLNEPLNYLQSLLRFNEQYDDNPIDPQGARLPLAIADHGNFSWQGEIAERSYDELARLLFWASVRPDAFEFHVTTNEVESGFSQERIQELRRALDEARKLASTEYGKYSRSSAQALWTIVLEISGEPEKFGLDLRTVSPSLVNDALRGAHDQIALLDDYARGRFQVTTPLIPEKVAFETVRSLVPFACAVSLFLLSYSLSKALRLLSHVDRKNWPAVETQLPLVSELACEGSRSRYLLVPECIGLIVPAAICVYWGRWNSPTDIAGAIFVVAATFIAITQWWRLRTGEPS